jgi:hypothetical protein
MGGRFDRDISDQRRPPAAERACARRLGPLSRRRAAERALPVLGCSWARSCRPVVSHPPHRHPAPRPERWFCQPRISTPWPRSARSPQTARVTAPKPEGLLGLTETHKILIGDPPGRRRGEVGGASRTPRTPQDSRGRTTFATSSPRYDRRVLQPRLANVNHLRHGREPTRRSGSQTSCSGRSW